MFEFSKRVLRAGLFSATIAIFAATASAAQAKFTLPSETHWGLAVLPAGEYTVSTALDTAWPIVFTVSGNDKTVYVLGSMDRINDRAEGSYLEIADVGGVKVVREFQSQVLGKTFHFDTPKELKVRLSARHAPEETTRVAVLTRH